MVKSGRFGDYVTDGEYNATLRKDDDVEAITLERAAELLADKRAKGPAKKRRTAKKAAAKKTTGHKTTKPAAKKSSCPKDGSHQLSPRFARPTPCGSHQAEPCWSAVRLAACLTSRSRHREASVLHLRSFRRLWIGLGLSSLGDWLGLLALTAMASELAPHTYAKQNFAIAGVLFLRVLPAVVLGPFAGTWLTGWTAGPR